MKTLYLNKKGDLYLEDTFNGTQKKVDTIKYYLDCPLRLGDGVTFETFFNYVIAEYKLMDIIFNETMGEYNLESFIEEWGKTFIKPYSSLEIDVIRFRKILEYIEVDKNKGFVDIRVDIDGVGKNNGVEYSLEFMSLSEMKKYPISVEDKIHIKRSLQKNDGERDNTKQQLIDTIDNENLIGVLGLQLDEAVRTENYEEAANLKTLIEKCRQIGK